MKIKKTKKRATRRLANFAEAAHIGQLSVGLCIGDGKDDPCVREIRRSALLVEARQLAKSMGGEFGGATLVKARGIYKSSEEPSAQLQVVVPAGGISCGEFRKNMATRAGRIAKKYAQDSVLVTTSCAVVREGEPLIDSTLVDTKGGVRFPLLTPPRGKR